MRALRCKLARMSEGGARLLPDFVGLAPGLASPVAGGGLLQQAGEAVRASLDREREEEGKGKERAHARVMLLCVGGVGEVAKGSAFLGGATCRISNRRLDLLAALTRRLRARAVLLI